MTLDGQMRLDEDERTIEERFERFHAANPEVYRLLVHYTRTLRRAGRERIGISLVWERLRWDVAIRTVGDELKLDNSYRSRYARRIMRDEPDLAGVFETRALRAR